MKKFVFFSLVCGLSVGLSGCGHHVIYQQVVKTESSVNTASSSVQQTGLLPAPVMVNQTVQSPHLRGVLLQRSTATGELVPAGQVQAMITPQQQRTLMMVPVSALNRQGVVYQPARSVPMVRIPVMALPAQAVQTKTYMVSPQALSSAQYNQQVSYQGSYQSGFQPNLQPNVSSANVTPELLEHLKATPPFESTEGE